MAPNPRVVNAFRAMKDLGISEDKVKPILKKLLKVYDKNWELIEEENYRALADAIFETEEAKEAESKKFESNREREKEEAQEPDDLERPLKRLRLKHQDAQASKSCSNSSSHLAGTSLKQAKDEPLELPEVHADNMLKSVADAGQPNNGETRNESQRVSCQSLDRDKGKQPVSPKPLIIRERSDPSRPVGSDKSQPNVQRRTESDVPPMHLRSRGKEALSPQITFGGKTSDFERSSPALHFQEPNTGCGILPSANQKTSGSQALLVPKEEPLTDDMLQFELPIAIVHPETSNMEDTSRKDSFTRDQALTSQLLVGKRANDGASATSSNDTLTNTDPPKVPDESSSHLQIASSTLGEVKLSLSCNAPPGRSDFRMPNVDAVIKMVEDRCLRSYKILDPNFSVMKVMKHFCECFLKLGSESCNESQETTQVSPRVDLFGKNSSVDPFVANGMPFNVPNGLQNSQSEADLAFPQILQLPPACNGVDDATQLNKNASEVDGGSHKENEQNGLDDANSKSLVVVQQLQLTPDQIRSIHDVIDISKGQERVVISLVNEVNKECPPSFHYIPKNAVFQNAYVNFSLARIGDDNCCSTCFGDCLSLSKPCACAHENGGEFLYTAEGLVKEEFLEECISMNHEPEKHCQFFCKECPLERSKNEDIMEPCKGHLVRKFIKECWWKCGCNKQCGNRVVQRGITRNLQVFMTKGKGWGLRTLEDLPKGAFVCEYVGEVLTNAELFDRVSKRSKGDKHSYPVLLDADWGCEGVLKDEEALCLDATCYGNVARFINHRCFDSNMVEIPVEVENPDHHYYHLAFFTTRNVKAMEELTWDYGIDFDDLDHPVKAFRCQCGSRYCRNMRRTNRSRFSRR